MDCSDGYGNGVGMKEPTHFDNGIHQPNSFQRLSLNETQDSSKKQEEDMRILRYKQRMQQ